MRIVLIEAGEPRDVISWTAYTGSDGRFALPPSGLVHLGSLVADDDEVSIIDEKVTGAVDLVEADLVGISFKTMYANHGYALADRLRAHDTPVVLGGPHVSLMPQEAMKHADAVVVGEGEAVWPGLLQDVRDGKLAPRYDSPNPPAPLDRLPPLRTDLIEHQHYMFHSMQSARGCTFSCEFCPTRKMFGSQLRLRNADSVAAEAAGLLEKRNNPILFTENVFGGASIPFIKDIASRLKDIDATYGVICDWPMVNAELIDALCRGGCQMVTLNLTGMCRPDEMKALDLVKKAGMVLWGYYMFGFEEDTADVFENTVRVVDDYDLDCVTLTVLSPYPGTPMGRRLRSEGRVFDENLDHYDQAHVVFEPAQMTRQQLDEGFSYALGEIKERTGYERLIRALEARD